MLDSLLLFGATGDLAQRYLFPSLLHLLRDRLHLRLSPPDADPAPATPSAIPPDSKARP